jgi:beta-galactosidase
MEEPLMRQLQAVGVLLLLSLSSCFVSPLWAQRVTVSLDGVWKVEDSVSEEEMPRAFTHTVPVPALTHSATPAFPDVDRFESRQSIRNQIGFGRVPKDTPIPEFGVSGQQRNYFWYTRTFRAPMKKQVAMLKVGKAQFGTAVWLNGKKIGEHMSCFTAGFFDLTGAINWSGENALVIRIGAHPGVVPREVPTGTDYEKYQWTPGVYDSVTVALSDNPVIETVQVAPRIQCSSIIVETVLRNYSAQPAEATVAHKITTWKEGKECGASASQKVALKPGEAKTLRETVRLANARLWSPEDPFLYILETSTGADSVKTRFGMREFRFDTATRRAYLNGKIYFLRGSNITLHRFFEDPKSGTLPWQEPWVRKMLVEIPKKMHWNSFRFCIGPAPEKWFDIADEAGLLIQNEYFIWTGREDWHQEWSSESLIREYSEFMRDYWNHPSMALWDAANETVAPLLGDEVIPMVRKLDLSDRPWENGYNVPSGPDDPVEDHPYLFSDPTFRMTSLETMTGAKSTNSGHPTGHAAFINEYGWLWLNRDGTPCLLTKKIYENLLGTNATPEERLSLNGYLLGGLTEFWRAHRNFAGVLHFVYLTYNKPEGYTSDHWRDIEKLQLDPYFADYVSEAFKPLGVYINFWQPSLKAGSEGTYAVMLANDYDKPAMGKLILDFETQDGKSISTREATFQLNSLGQITYVIPMEAPRVTGNYLLKATAMPVSGPAHEPTISRRKVKVE